MMGELGVNPFQAKIGPPRIFLGVMAIGYALVNIGFEMLTRGEFEPLRHVDEILALAFGVLNLIQELNLSIFRNRFVVVEMNEQGLFDRRIMYERLAWEDIEWIEPHPGGVPDRLRVKAQVRLTPFGAVRNRLLCLIRHIPQDEVVVTFGGLNKATAQAAAWLADHQPRLIPDVWKITTVQYTGAIPTEHRDICLRAFVYPRAWLGYLASGVVVVALLFALVPTLVVPSMAKGKVPEDLAQFALIGLIAAAAIIGGIFSVLTYVRLSSDRNGVIILSQTGLTDIRISSQFIPWNHIDHVTFHWLNNGRLVNEAIAVQVKLQEGIKLKPPEGGVFWLAHRFRQIAHPELFDVRHAGTTTSVSEIIDHIERHNLPVALREIARN